MSLLTIAGACCGLTPVVAPSAIVGSNSRTAILLLAVANQAGQALMRRAQGGWVAQIREFDFTTAAIGAQSASVTNIGPGGTAVLDGLDPSVTAQITPAAWVAQGPGLPNNAVVTAVGSTTVTVNVPASSTLGGLYQFGQSDYALPTDFQRPVDNTFWDRSRFWSMRGPQSPQQWQVYKSSVIGRATMQRRFRFRASNVIYGAGGAPGVSVLSIDPTPFDAGSQFVFEYVSNGWCQSATDGTLQSSWQADSDIGVLDEYLLQLGTQWRFLRRLGLSYNEELDEYEREVDKALAVDGGSAVLNLTPMDSFSLLGPYNLPETGYGDGGSSGGFAIGVSGIGGAGLG